MSNLEMAILILLVGLALWSITNRSVRPKIFVLVKIILGAKIVTVVVIYFGYSVGLVYLAWNLGLWESSLVKDTIITILVVGMPMVFNAHEIESGLGFVKQTVWQTIGISTFLTYYLNLSSLPVFVNLLLIVLVVGGGFIIAASKSLGKEGRPFVLAMSIIIFAISMTFLTSATISAVHIWRKHQIDNQLQGLWVSIWLPLLLIPFIYFLGFFVQCQLLFTMLPFFNDHRKLKILVRLAIFLGFRMRISLVTSFVGDWRLRTTGVETYGVARKLMGDFRREMKATE